MCFKCQILQNVSAGSWPDDTEVVEKIDLGLCGEPPVYTNIRTGYQSSRLSQKMNHWFYIEFKNKNNNQPTKQASYKKINKKQQPTNKQNTIQKRFVSDN